MIIIQVPPEMQAVSMAELAAVGILMSDLWDNLRARKFIKLMGCTCVRRFENVK